MVSVDPLPGDREPEASGLHAGTARRARVRGPSGERASRSASWSTSHSSSGIETVTNGGMRPEPSRRCRARTAARTPTDPEARARSSCRRPPPRARAPHRRDRRSAAGVAAGRSAFTTSAWPSHAASAAPTALPSPPPGSGKASRVGGHDGRVVGHDENAADLERGLDDVAEHGHGEGRPQSGGDTSLRVAPVGDDDRRHAPKRSQAAFEEVPSAPGPERRPLADVEPVGAAERLDTSGSVCPG